MEAKKKSRIYVEMLGGFSLYIGDKQLDLGNCPLKRAGGHFQKRFD